VLKRIAECKFAPPETVNPLVGARLSKAIKKALEREPSARFPDVAPMRRELIEDLADVGVEDPRKELQAFFADPKGWAQAFRPKLVARLTERGRALQSRGRTAGALEAWGRALSLDPKSTELRALIDSIARRRRAGRAAIAGGLTLAVATLLTFGVRFALRHQVRPDGIRGVPPIESNVPPVKVTAPEHPAPAPAPKPAPHHPAVKIAHPQHVETPPPAPEPAPVPVVLRKFTLNPTPKSVLVSIDGKKPVEFDPTNAIVELGPGPHVVKFSNPSCYAADANIGADDPGGEIKKHLGWLPATLTVQTTPDDASILVDNKTAVLGHKTLIRFENDPRRKVPVNVSATGYDSQTIDVEMKANEPQTVTVTLKAKSGG
jgi:serine/threonine-protein kinase